MCHQFMIQWLLFFTHVDKDEPSVGNPTDGMFFADVDSLRIELGRLLEMCVAHMHVLTTVGWPAHAELSSMVGEGWRRR
jgi:hypothetical protein